MSQISPPVRILLAGAIIFLAAWFVVLRPKAATVEPVATPATATPAATVQAGSATATKPAAKPAAPAGAPAAALKGLPKPVVAALNSHKTIVLGVIGDGATAVRPLSDDDRYVRNALRKANRYSGQVVVKTVPVGSLAAYQPIVGELQVNQTPSVVVVDGAHKAHVLTGYVDTISINQAIADARRATTSPLITDRYLRSLNSYCQQYVTSEDRWSWPTIRGRKPLIASLDRRAALENRYHRLLVGIPAPAKWRGLKGQFVEAQGRLATTVSRMVKALKTSDEAAFNRADAGYWVPRRQLDARLDRLGVTSCVADRRS